MKSYGIVSQLTLPYTPQHNGVFERRNQTLLDMVRSMMNLTTLPKSFWGYALKSAARISHYAFKPRMLKGMPYVQSCMRSNVLDLMLPLRIISRVFSAIFSPSPGEIHWTVVKDILKYLRNTKDMTDKDDTKSQTGYVFVLNGGAMDWKSVKQSTTAMSSTEAEYIVVAKALMKAVWMRKCIDRLGSVVPSNKIPMKMLCDNKPAIAMANDLGFLKGAKHY
ncbi:retrotransposon protein, putative, ty1-copia subclass [Tanacetum coccineum]